MIQIKNRFTDEVIHEAFVESIQECVKMVEFAKQYASAYWGIEL